jgi:dephospho-CoA kinase
MLMLKIAVTGGPGSGKSTVLKMFQDLGVATVDADQVARDVVAVGRPAWEELRRAFGPAYFKENGALDRHQMAHLVFSDPEARRRLNDIIHPRMAQEIKARLADLERQGADLALVEVPLFFEAGLEKAYDRVIVVYAGEEDQVSRLSTRDHRDAAEISGIITAQWPLKDKMARADFIVDNSGPLSRTRVQVEKILRELKKIILTKRGKMASVIS